MPCKNPYTVVSNKGTDSNLHVSKQMRKGKSSIPDLKQSKIANGKIGGGGSDKWHSDMHKDSNKMNPLKGAYSYGKKVK